MVTSIMVYYYYHVQKGRQNSEHSKRQNNLEIFCESKQQQWEIFIK